MYEFLFGFPPFHDETPDKVFENIIARRISWYEDQIEISPEARDLMERLMCTDPLRRLGANGAAEIKSHPFFAEVNWDTIATIEANFVPDVTDPESTDYFDARGALPQVFNEDDEEPKCNLSTSSIPLQTGALSAPAEIDASASTEDFGSFHYKNVHVLKEANDEQVRKLRKDSALQSESMLQGHIKDRRLSLAIGKKKRRHRLSMSDVSPSLFNHGVDPYSTLFRTGPRHHRHLLHHLLLRLASRRPLLAYYHLTHVGRPKIG